MFTVKQLFIRRLGAYWIYQIRLLRMIVDWTVALYIVIPGLLFAGYEYASWWKSTPFWLEWVPFLVIVLILFQLATSGTVRLFVEEGDQLFLLRHVNWMRGILTRGITYSIIVHFAASLVFVLLLAPLMLNYYLFSPLQIIVTSLLICCFRVSTTLAVHSLSIQYNGWSYGFRIVILYLSIAALFIPTLFYLIDWPLLVLVLCGILSLISIKMVNYRLNVKGSFFHDIAHEQKQHMKIAAILLRGIVEKKPKYRRKSPRLFANSNLLFKLRTPANGLAEMCIKSFSRSWPQLKIYLLLVALGGSLLGLPILPVWMKGIVWLSMAFILCYFLKNYWKDTLTSDFVQLFPWKQMDKIAGAQKAVFIMVLPGFLLITLVLGLSSFSWLGALLMMPIGYYVVYGISHIMTPWQ